MAEPLIEAFPLVPSWVWLTIAFFYGAIIGSFLNVCIHRIPRGEEIVRTPSHCPTCGARIPWYLNVPIVSWFVLRGRTACCGVPLTFRYPLVELASAVLTVSLFARRGLTPQFGAEWVFVSLLLVLIFIDWEHMRLPNALTLPGAALGLAVAIAGFGVSIADSLLGIAVGAGGFFLVALLYKMLRGVEGLGMGDVKLMAMIGAFLGWERTLVVIILGSLLGLLYGIWLAMRSGTGGMTRLPYGVFLGLAAIGSLLYGNWLLGWYVGMFGVR
jgi:leader peptidase (prepilin peptidase)/N-methyltransferase